MDRREGLLRIRYASPHSCPAPCSMAGSVARGGGGGGNDDGFAGVTSIWLLIAGNVAKHLHLAALERLHFKVPLNLILVGFEGEGEHGVKVSHATHRRMASVCTWISACVRYE